jgi:hypothetical protein
MVSVDLKAENGAHARSEFSKTKSIKDYFQDSYMKIESVYTVYHT